MIPATAIGAIGTCLFLVAGLCGGTSHHVEGSVEFLRRPLPEAMLCFHNGDSVAPCMSTVTRNDGHFVVDIPAGSYKVTVRSIGDSDQGLPPEYGRVESTPLNLSVERDVTSATMFIESK